MTQQQTYGIYSVQPRGISLKDDRDNGWVADIKWAFTTGAKPERKLELEHLSVLKGASASDGVRLELTPRIDGTHLEPVMLGVTQRGNITIGEEGEVLCTTRITLDALETAGLGIDAILAASNCLECTVSEQPTLDESAKALEGQGEEDVPQQVADDRRTREVQAEVDGLVEKVHDLTFGALDRSETGGEGASA